MLRSALALVLAGWLAAPAAGGDITLPPGFNPETLSLPGPVAAVLEDGSALLSTGSFGADALSLLHPDGSLTPFAEGIGSLAGVARSPLTGDIVVGDSLGDSPLWVLRDLNGDGDALDPGEHSAHPAALPVLSGGAAPLPFDLAFRSGTDELYVSGSTPFGFLPLQGAVLRVAGGAASVYADGLGLAAGLLFDGDTLYVADVDAVTFAGQVRALSDTNGDGDALDPGESVAFASGLSGASGLAQAADGCLYLSGLLDPADFSGSIGRLLPDDDGNGVSDGVDEVYFDGYGFAAGLVLLEGPAGFLPGRAGDGLLYVTDFAPTFDILPRTVRSAPRSELAVSGTLANNASFDVTVSGNPGALARFVLSLDLDGMTLPGIGDLGLGFGAPFVLSAPVAIPAPEGSVSTTILVHGADAAVGLPFAAQAFTLEGGDIGLSNTLQLTLAP